MLNRLLNLCLYMYSFSDCTEIDRLSAAADAAAVDAEDTVKWAALAVKACSAKR
jgi:hypothetical protein